MTSEVDRLGGLVWDYLHMNHRLEPADVVFVLGSHDLRVARERGVPEEAILVEERSTNTGENVRFTRALLAERGVDLETFLLVQKPYMERRAYATFEKFWPGKRVRVTSPAISFEDYPNDEISREQVIHIMVGDLQRIRIYPARGFQIEQEIPEEVRAAYERLVALGFTDNLVKE